jgi:hypothetical protein
MRGSRLADEDFEAWEAEFQEFMAAADDEEDIEPFLPGLLVQHCCCDSPLPHEHENFQLGK